MLTTSAEFDTYHGADGVTPMVLVHFDGETTDYCDHEPTSPDNTLARYLVSLSGGSQTITPEEGRSNISGYTVVLQDKDGAITTLLATDSYYFHRRKTTIKFGYLGMSEAGMLTICVGWVTSIRKSRDLGAYEFSITDPQKWFQRKVFRSATDATPTTLTGHPLRILLQVLTSTGAGTNGDYDTLAAADGLGIDTDHINLANILQVWEDWFPNNTYHFSFTITDPIVAKRWFETEIFKVLNIYPVIDGDGKFNIKPFKPPLPTTTSVQTFDETVVSGYPEWDMNLEDTINEMEVHFGWNSTADEFSVINQYIDTNSVNNRGPGKQTLTIKSKGLTTEYESLAATRRNRVFHRFAAPPPKINVETKFDRMLTEVGDIVPVTHTLLPDTTAGSIGISGVRMEVIKRAPDFRNLKCKFTLLETGFAKSPYIALTPNGTITACSSTHDFSLSTGDMVKFSSGDEIVIHKPNRLPFTTNLTITSIGATGLITVDTMGTTALPSSGFIIGYADYDVCSTGQQRYWFLNSSSTKGIGASSAPAHLITP